MPRIFLHLLIGIGLLSVLDARTWTPVGDAEPFEGDLLAYRNGTVIIERAGGRGKVLLQIESFSGEDRAYIRERFPDGDPEPAPETPATADSTERHTARLADDGFIEYEPVVKPPARAEPKRSPKRAPAAEPARKQPANSEPPLPHLSGLRIGQAPPALEVYPQGEPEGVPLSTFRNRVVLIIFWAPRDKVSASVMPLVVDLYRRYQERGVEFIGIGLEAARPVLNNAEKQLGITFPARQDRANAIADAWGVSYLPTFVLLDQSGRVVRDNLRFTEIEPLLRKYLGLD